MSGKEPMRFVVLRSSLLSIKESVKSVGNIHGARLVLLLMVRSCKLIRPWKQPSGMEVKLLLLSSRYWRKVRLAREGRGPERELLWRSSLVSWDRELRPEGSVPVSDLEWRSMAST